MRVLCGVAFVAAGFIAGIAGAPARAADGEMAIAYRQGVFKTIYWNFARMGEMVRGARDLDTTEFSLRASRVAMLSGMIEEGFPAGSDHGGMTEAKAAIWSTWDDFTAKLGDFQREAAALRDVAGAGDAAAIKAQFVKVRATCAACHDAYKED